MTIKIEKETGINFDPFRGELGIEIIWHWVRAYDASNSVILQKVYIEQADAQKAYDGMVAYYDRNKTFDSKIAVLATHEIVELKSSLT